MSGLDWLIERPIAHRGLHGALIVENTLGAARAAVGANYAIEVDLQLTADGEVVVFHDSTLERLTQASGLLAARTLTELKGIRLRECDERIPTLQELLDAVADRTPLVLELKSEWDGDDQLVKRVAEILVSYSGPVAAMSFDPAQVAALRDHAPGLPRGIVAERYYQHPDWQPMKWQQRFSLGNLLHIGQTKPHFVAYFVRELPAFAPLFARHALGMKLLTWTVRTEADRRKARRWADQIVFEGFRP
jgi:glycerophosphoryl diester phosphodiesterase